MGKATKERRAPAKAAKPPVKPRSPASLRSEACWQRRHPRLAHVETALRLEREAVLEAWDHKREGTPETHQHAARVNEGGLQRLYERGRIDRDQLAAAEQIGLIRQRIEAEVQVRTASHEMRVDSSPRYGNALVESLMLVRLEMAYTAWRKSLPINVAGVILDIVTGHQMGYTVAAQRHNMSPRRALRVLKQALSAWPSHLDNACRCVDHAKLIAAHAALS